MTFNEIVTEVMDRLNLTSSTAITRVGRAVNDRYRRLTSSIGLETTRRVEVSAPTVIGEQTLVFTGVEKLIAVIDKTSGTDIILNQITPDEMHIITLRTDPPRNWCLLRSGATTVTIKLDCVPASVYNLYADGHTSITSLTGTGVPAFPESFHDTLIFGAMADEYRKMEKTALMADAEMNYDKRLSDLRMWIAKTAYLDVYQGKSLQRFPWMTNQ